MNQLRLGLLQQGLGLLQCLGLFLQVCLRVFLVGNVFNEPFVVTHLPPIVANGAQLLHNPNGVTVPMVNLGFPLLVTGIAVEVADKGCASGQIEVKGLNIWQTTEQFFRGIVAADARQRRICGNQPSVWRKLDDAF